MSTAIASPAPAKPALQLSHIPVCGEADIAQARRQARELARRLGFPQVGLERVNTVVVELAHNILKHAGKGEIFLLEKLQAGLPGVDIIARDRGPGISDLRSAIPEPLAGAAQRGLPAVFHLGDDFELRNRPGKGTAIRATFWLKPEATPI